MSKPEQQKAEAGKNVEAEISDSGAPKTPPTTPSKASTKVQSSKVRSNSAKSGLLLIWLILFLLITGLAAGTYFAWQWYQRHDFSVLQTVRQDRDNQQKALQAMQAEMEAGRQARHLLQREAKAAGEHLESQLKRQNTQIEAMASSSLDDWRLAEAEYLIRLAGQRVAIGQSDRVLVLLNRADDILRDLDDLKLLSVRQSLANDINAVKLAGKVDREGLYLRLNTLKAAIGQLSLTPTPEVQNDTGEKALSDDRASKEAETSIGRIGRSWKNFIDHAGQAFGRFWQEHFQIRMLDAPEKALMMPDQELYLRQNLQLVLSQAQLALLEEQSVVYGESLKQAVQWLQVFFQLDERAALAIAELEFLQQQAISADLPDISDSLAALQQYLDERDKQHLPKVGSAPQ